MPKTGKRRKRGARTRATPCRPTWGPSEGMGWQGPATKKHASLCRSPAARGVRVALSQMPGRDVQPRHWTGFPEQNDGILDF